MTGNDITTQRVLNGLVSLELAQRIDAFEAAIEALRAQTERWSPALLTPEDFSVLGSGGIPRGEITIELVFDRPGHVRLPINDDEIIDRILAIQPLAAREVRLLTYDTGQSTRARAAGLHVTKLAKSQEDEPATTARPSRNGKR